MKLILKLEELGMFLFGIHLFSQLDYPWWIFAAFFFVPDIGILGYLAGDKVGAVIYNFLHHKGIAVFFLLAGIFYRESWLELSGIILFSHACFDRVVGYGLKYKKGFHFTHIG